MGSALETLCGQAFGAGQIHMLGVFMQRSWIILTATATLLTPIYIFAAPILKLLGQADDISDLAGNLPFGQFHSFLLLLLIFQFRSFFNLRAKSW
jgi:MATE family multidrug resistance protein